MFASEIGRCTHEVFEQRASETPGALALLYKDQRFTFGELNTKANQLAHFLQKLGVQPDVPVGVHLGRSAEAVVTLLGVLKAGGAFVVLDPNNPGDRLEQVVRHARLRLVLTNALTNSGLAARRTFGDAEAVDLDEMSARISRESSADVCSGVVADNAAYIAYTSGSAGQPKAVIVRHRGLVAQMAFMPFEPGDVCGLNMSLEFAWAAHRLLVPLMFGASVAIIPEEMVTDAREWLSALGITNIALVPAALRQILELDAPVRSRLRTVTVGGTMVSPDLIESFLRLMPGARLFHLYGSSEALAICMSEITEAELVTGAAAVEPVDTARVYVLDANMQRAPTGTIGELYVGGPQLARGYLHDPALTAESFLPDPFDGTAGERIYRTGDLGRCLPDGKIELAGREDRQIKIRGFRVELGEIEADLARHEAVKEAAVIAREIDGETRLVAYVAAKAGEALTAGQLHNHMRERLPDYMIPSAFVWLEQLPLNSRGKLDAAALPNPATARPELSTSYEAPRDSAETAIAQIWAAQLGLDQVGIHDNFIELGGDSLIAAKIVSRIHDTLGIKVPFRTILEGTVCECSAELLSEPESDVTF